MPVRIRIGIYMLLILLLGGSSVWAQRPAIEIVPFTGLRAGGSFEDGLSGKNLSVNGAAVYGITVNVDYDASGQLQLLWSHQDSDFKLPNDPAGKLHLDIDYYHFGGTYSWAKDEKLWPYAAASVGITDFNPGNSRYDNELRFSMGLGLGLKYFVTERIGLVLEGRGYGTFMSGSASIFCDSGSCQILVDSDLFIQIEGRIGLVFRF